MLKGAVRLLKRGGFVEPEISRQLKQEHRVACHHEVEYFREHLKPVEDAEFVPTEAIYPHYRTWASSRGYHPVCQKRFVQALRRALPTAVRHRQKVDVERWPELASKPKPRGHLGLLFFSDGVPEEDTDGT